MLDNQLLNTAIGCTIVASKTTVGAADMGDAKRRKDLGITTPQRIKFPAISQDAPTAPDWTNASDAEVDEFFQKCLSLGNDIAMRFVSRTNYERACKAASNNSYPANIGLILVDSQMRVIADQFFPVNDKTAA